MLSAGYHFRHCEVCSCDVAVDPQHTGQVLCSQHVVGIDRVTRTVARQQIKPQINGLQSKVLTAIELAGGLTDEQCQRQLSMPANTQRARRVELTDAGYVKDSGRRRPTESGRKAIVWTSTRKDHVKG